MIKSADIFEEKYGCKKFRTEGIIKTEEQERMAEEFERKVEAIEADASEVRECNHRLYENIFDLEQKVAFLNEEGLKMENRLR